VAGIFLFVPLLTRLRLDEIVRRAGYPGSRRVPAPSAWLSLLALKLLDKERRSYLNDFNRDAALGALTVVANGCYRWLAKQLRGFDKAAPKQLFRKFVETSGGVVTEAERVVVHFDKRCHNPIVREAALAVAGPPIPWLGNKTRAFVCP
jgi:hypothetical protein